MPQPRSPDPPGFKATVTLLSRHALPLGLKADSRQLPWHGAERATFTLLRAGQRDVLVTCFHVVKRLWEMQRVTSSAQIVAYLTSGPCLTEVTGFTLLDYDERSLDVAVFSVLEHSLVCCNSRGFTMFRPWRL